MLENYLNNIVNEVKQNQNNQNADEVQIREQYQQFAENNLRWFLLRKSIISDKELSVSPNEVEDFIKDALLKNESQKAEIERFYKKESNKNKLSDDLLDQKIIDMLKEHSKIKEKDQINVTFTVIDIIDIQQFNDVITMRQQILPRRINTCKTLL